MNSRGRERKTKQKRASVYRRDSSLHAGIVVTYLRRRILSVGSHSRSGWPSEDSRMSPPSIVLLLLLLLLLKLVVRERWRGSSSLLLLLRVMEVHRRAREVEVEAR